MFLKLNFKIHNDVLLILDENLSIKIYPSHLEQVFKLKLFWNFIVFLLGLQRKREKVNNFRIEWKNKKNFWVKSSFIKPLIELKP